MDMDEFPPIEEPEELPPQPKGVSFKVDPQTIIGGCLVALLILGGLMLPPVALGRRLFGFGYSRITANNPTATLDGLTVSLAQPDGSLAVKLSEVSSGAFENHRAGRVWSQAFDGLPATLQLVGPIYELDGRGQPSSEVLIDVTIPTGTSPAARLDLYSWDSKKGVWVFLPHQDDPASGALHARLDSLPESVAVFNARMASPLLAIVQEPNQSIDPELGASANILMPAGLQPSPNGTLTGSMASGALGNFSVVPLVRNYSDPANVDTASVSAILADTTIQQAHLDALVNLVAAGGNDGVAIDYRGLLPEQGPSFTALMTALANTLHEQGKTLIIVLPPPTPGPDPTTWNTAGYEWRALGAVADVVEVQPSPSPGDYVSSGIGGQALGWATGEISRYKILLSISTLSADVSNGVATPITYEQALERLTPTVEPPLPAEGEAYPAGESLTFTLGGEGVSNVGTDETSGLYRYEYTDDSAHQVWIMTADKLRERLALAATYGLAGVSVHDLLAEGNADGIQQAVVAYKVSAPVVAQEGLQVRWNVKNAAGETMQFDTLAFGAPFSWLANVEGQLSADASVLDPEKRERGSLSFVVGAVAATPTPTPAPAPAAPQPAAPAPVVSSAGGSFELGGQTHTLENAGLMHDIGMTWVKFQEKWEPGASGYDLAGDIELAHSNGFKVLFSIPGPAEPDSIDFDAYTQYVREVADAGADGIEIWNEMNLSREWPANDISGASYVNNMLAPAYNAIKGVDPSILVISGALAPTGAFGGGCGDVGFVSGCDDYYYVGQMASAGAANYMDCVGVHFNAGATSPSANSGHPAGTAPGWYFWGTVNTYTPLGKPVCFTELGYLSDDGYASVGGTNFGWADGTSVDQQAQWLAEAVSLGRGFARLLIVWNVDIFTYDPSDPQGGYAIIRPDGSCPACDALAP